MDITPSTIYWIGTCDSIFTACIFLTAVFFISGIAISCAFSEMKQERTAILSFFFFLILVLASIGGAVFTPSSKTAAAMYVVPAIVNNEKIKDIGSGIYDLALEWMKELKPKNCNGKSTDSNGKESK